jgi:hypothetical protein
MAEILLMSASCHLSSFDYLNVELISLIDDKIVQELIENLQREVSVLFKISESISMLDMASPPI